MQNQYRLMRGVTERCIAYTKLRENISRMECKVLRRPHIRFLHIVLRLRGKYSRHAKQEYRDG